MKQNMYTKEGMSVAGSVDMYGCVKFITETSEALKMGIVAFKSNVFTYLEKSKEKATIIFADPPYDLPLESFEKIPDMVFKNEGQIPNLG